MAWWEHLMGVLAILFSLSATVAGLFIYGAIRVSSELDDWYDE